MHKNKNGSNENKQMSLGDLIRAGIPAGMPLFSFTQVQNVRAGSPQSEMGEMQSTNTEYGRPYLATLHHFLLVVVFAVCSSASLTVDVRRLNSKLLLLLFFFFMLVCLGHI